MAKGKPELTGIENVDSRGEEKSTPKNKEGITGKILKCVRTLIFIALSGSVCRADNSEKFKVTQKDTFDRQTLNHVYYDGEWVLDQILYEDFFPTEESFLERVSVSGVNFMIENKKSVSFAVIDYLLVKNKKVIPHYDNIRKRYVAVFFDSRHDVLRTIESNDFVETWTNYDEEISNRSFFDINERRLLSVRKKPKYRTLYPLTDPTNE